MSTVTDVFGYSREDLLELEPGEIGGAIVLTLGA